MADLCFLPWFTNVVQRIVVVVVLWVNHMRPVTPLESITTAFALVVTGSRERGRRRRLRQSAHSSERWQKPSNDAPSQPIILRQKKNKFLHGSRRSTRHENNRGMESRRIVSIVFPPRTTVYVFSVTIPRLHTPMRVFFFDRLFPFLL